MPGEECPTCGEMFETERAMKVHHAHAHDESIADEPLSERYTGNVECPTCGKGGFDGQSGMKRHHSIAHDEQLPLTPNSICEVCGSEFYARPFRKQRRETCSARLNVPGSSIRVSDRGLIRMASGSVGVDRITGKDGRTSEGNRSEKGRIDGAPDVVNTRLI